MNTDDLTTMFDEDLLTPDPAPDTTGDPSPDTESGAAPPASELTAETVAAADTETPGEDAPPVESGDEGQTEAKAPETVPLANYLETKAAVKAQEERNNELNRRLDTVMDLLNKQTPAAPEPPAVEEPKNEINPDEDLVGYLRRENEILNEKMGKLTEQVEGTQQATQTQATEAQFLHNLGLAESQFKQQNPDYDQAVDYVRAQERESLGMYLDQLIAAGKAQPMDEATRAHTVEAQLRRNEIQAAYVQQMQGLNPVEAIYKLAKVRGYAPAAGEGGETKEESPEAKRIREKAEQQAATQTLGAGGADLTRETITEGSYDEFEAALAGRGFKR